MASIADVYVTVLPETAHIADDIRTALLKADREVKKAAQRWKYEIETVLRDVEVKVDFKVNKQKAEREIKEATKDKTATINADADTGKAEAKLDATARPRKAKIVAEVDDASVARAGKKISKNLSQSEGFFGKSGGINLPFRATIPLPIGIEAIGLAPNVVPLIRSMVNSIGQLTGVMGLIPAAAGAAALAIGSLKIGVSGFSDALKEIGDPTKFAEAIKQLSPAAQEAATAIQGLMPQVTQLKMTVQDALFTGMGEQFSKLGSTYLPIFQDVMSRMASSAGQAFQGVSKILQTPEMQSSIKTFGVNASTAFSTLLQAAQPLVKAFTDIATVGSSFLPQLAQIVADLAGRFERFIASARESGKLGDWIQDGILAMTQLKDIAVNVWNTFSNIFDASGAGDFLQTIQNLTGTWASWTNSIGGQNSLKAFFDEAKDSWDKWWPILQDAGTILYNAFVGAKAALDPFVSVFGEFVAALAKSPGLIQAIAGAFAAWNLVGLLGSLTGISTMLSTTLPAAAAAGAGSVTASLSGMLAAVTVPAWLTWLVGGGAVAALGIGTAKAVDLGYDITTSRYGQRPGHTGAPGGPTDPNAWTGGGGPIGPAGPADIAGRDFGVGRGRWGGLPPSAGPHAPKAPKAPAIQPYIPPMPSPGGGGAAGGGGGAPTPVAPPGMSYTYGGFGELNWEALAQAEAGGNWNMNTGNGFYGGLQFIQSTWEAYGGLQFADRADLADKSDQIKVATALYNAEGPAPWPDNGWLLTATPDQLNQAGLTGSGRQSTSAGTRGRGGYGGSGGAPSLTLGAGGIPTVASGTSFNPSGSQQPARATAGAISQLFPGIKTIGGQRPDSMPYHREGRAIDVMIPNYNTPEGKAMGDQIKQWVMDNAQALGAEDVIWQDFWQPTGGGAGHSLGRRGQGDTAGHMDHVHVTFKSDATASAAQLTGGGGAYYGPGSQYTYDGPGGSQDNPMYTTSKDSGGEQLGKDIITGMLDVFGFGDVFKSPLDFGAFKLFKGMMGIPDKMFGNATDASTGQPLFGSGGGGGGPGGFISNLLGGFGALGSGSPDNAPGEFIPGLSAGGGGGLGDFMSGMVPGAGPAQQGRGGGMVNSGNFTANITAAQANAKEMGPILDGLQLPQARNLARSTGQ